MINRRGKTKKGGRGKKEMNEWRRDVRRERKREKGEDRKERKGDKGERKKMRERELPGQSSRVS